MAKESDDYELMPVKPIQDLQKEVKALRKELTKETKYEKLLVKHLNVNVILNRKVTEISNELNKTNQKIEKIMKVFVAMAEAEEDESLKEHTNKIKELSRKIEILADHNKKLGEMMDLISKEIKNQRYFKNRFLPKGMKIKYSRTK